MQFFSKKALSELHDHAENQRWVRQINGFPLFVGLMPALEGTLGRWLKKKEGTRQALLESDQVLLSVLRERGHLRSLPLLVDTDRRDKDPSSFFPRLGRQGLVTVCSRLDGSPVEFETVTTPTVSRWFVLLHEVGHQEFQFEPTPFQPSPESGLAPDLVHRLNQWTLGPLGLDGMGRSILNECFADVYASMVMLSCLEGEVLDMAEAQIRANHAARWSHANKADRLYVKDLDESDDFGQPLLEHLTGHALDRMWASRETWKNASVSELKAKALELASDGWLDALSPSRLDGQTGFPLGWSYRWNGLPPSLEESLGEAALQLGSAYRVGTPLKSALGDWQGANPVLEKVLALALPALKESFDKRFPDARRTALENTPLGMEFSDLVGWSRGFAKQLLEAPSPMVQPEVTALKKAHQEACAHIFNAFIEQPARQAAWTGAFVQASVALKQQRKALGLDVLVPPSPGVWRQNREPCSPIASVGSSIKPS